MDDKTEDYIILTIQYCSDLGWPMGKEQVQDLVENFIKVTKLKTIFKNDRPGDEWFRSFTARHKDKLAIRKPETVTTARAKSLSATTITSCFDLLYDII